MRNKKELNFKVNLMRDIKQLKDKKKKYNTGEVDVLIMKIP